MMKRVFTALLALCVAVSSVGLDVQAGSLAAQPETVNQKEQANTETEKETANKEEPSNAKTEEKGSSKEEPFNAKTEEKGSSKEELSNAKTEEGSSKEEPSNAKTEEGSSEEEQSKEEADEADKAVEVDKAGEKDSSAAKETAPKKPIKQNSVSRKAQSQADESGKKAEEEEAEKAAKEKAAKEEAEKAAKEKAAKEEAEKAAAEKAAKEEAEKAAKEKAAKEEAEKAAKEKAAKEEKNKKARNAEPAEKETDTDSKEETAEEKELSINYLLIEKARVQTPDTQNIVVSLGEETDRLENPVLTYKNKTTGTTYTVKSSGVAEDMVLFSISFTEENQSGEYELESIQCSVNGKNRSISLSQAKMQVNFGVNTEVNVQPDDVIYDEALLKEVDASVVTMDENGNTVSEQNVEDVLRSTQEQMPAAASARAAVPAPASARKGNLVVVLDPGHDATHAGAHYYGYGEESLVFKIAKYCRDELKKYSGVTVYMTRETEGCPNGGSSVDSGTCNARRVEFAQSKKADVYVSFHLNASVSTTANGVGVYYPNSNYRPEIGQEGGELAKEIYEKLSALGLGTWAGGTLIRNSQDNSLYPDGSLADYLGVIRRSKLAGIPAVLIEHAFMSNPAEVENFLSSDAKLKKLGQADAKGIAGYYGLKKKNTTPSISQVYSKSSGRMQITWGKVSGAKGYRIYRSTKKDSGYERIAQVGNVTSYTDTVSAGKTYYYKVKAILSDGSISSSSAAVSGKTAGKTSILSIKAAGSRKLQIKWKKVSGATGYQIYRATAKNGKYTRVKTVGAGTTSYTNTVPKNNTKYYYKVRALNKNNGKTGVGTSSEIKYGRVLDKAKITSVYSKSSGRMQITWEKTAGAKGYRIYRSRKKNSGYERIAQVGNVSSYTDAVHSGKTYYYKIKPVLSDGSLGSSSSAVSGKTVGKTRIVSIKPTGSRKIQLKWKKVSGASGYQVYRATAKNGKYTRVKTVSAKTTSYTNTVPKNNTKYYYKVRALNKNNGKTGTGTFSEAEYSSAVGKTSITAVESVNAKELKISWKKVSGASGYKIRRSESKTGKYKVIKTVKSGKTTSYVDKSIKEGKTYYYQVQAYNKVNGETGVSGYCTAVYGKTSSKTTITGVKSVSSSKMKITWKEVSGAYGYRVKRSTSSKGKYTVVATIKGKDNTSFQDSKLKSGKKYYYVVEVINKVGGKKGYSGNSKAASERTLAKPEVSLRGISSSKIEISWDKVTGASGYQVRRSETKGGSSKVIATVKGSGNTSYTDTNVTPGKTYYYKVRAYKTEKAGNGYSSYSATEEKKTLKKTAFTKISSTSENKINLEWKKISGATGYRLQRSTTSSRSGFKTIKTITSGNVLEYSDTSVKPGVKYYYRVAAIRQSGKITERGDYSSVKTVFTLKTPSMSAVKYVDSSTLGVYWNKTANAAGYQLQRSTKASGGYKSIKTLSGTKYTNSGLFTAKKYYYRVRAYGTLSDGTKVYSPWSKYKSGITAYGIMGKSSLTAAEMADYYNERYTYDSAFYSKKGAPTAKDFFLILKEEAAAEGVRAEVVFAQVILETGGLTYPGDVDKSQCNFAGIGATGGGVKGNTFPDVRTGLRAQIQHLKAYASDEPLKNPCVDPRFQYVTRMTAPYVEWLGIPKNPYGTGWAADPDYASKLLRIIKAVG